MGCPIAGAVGRLRPEGTCANGVMILGESMGDTEVEEGLPFRPSAPAGSVLERAIRKVGMDRQQFVLWNVLPCQPPNNKIPKRLESEAIEWGREYVEEQIKRYNPRCILALGNIPIRAASGLVGDKLSVSYLTGYVLPGAKSWYPPVVVCFHPSYIRRGKMSHLGVLMRCIRLAVNVARGITKLVLPPMDNPPPGYILQPTEAQALEFLYQTGHQPEKGYLAYDIETHYSTDEDDAEERAGDIKSVQFSLSPGTGIFFPWHEPFIDITKQILATPIHKVSWNGWRFDDPKLRTNGCNLAGSPIDLMWAWHQWQPDLPRKLQFAAAMMGPRLHDPTHSWSWPWKHLDRANPPFYGIVDVDVLQWMVSYV